MGEAGDAPQCPLVVVAVADGVVVAVQGGEGQALQIEHERRLLSGSIAVAKRLECGQRPLGSPLVAIDLGREQEQFLKYSLKDAENVGKSVNEMIAAWKAGDAKKIEEFLLEAAKDSPDMQSLFVKLFDERNVHHVPDRLLPGARLVKVLVPLLQRKLIGIRGARDFGERVRELQPYFHGDYIVLMHDGTQLTLSRNYRPGIGERFGNLF